MLPPSGFAVFRRRIAVDPVREKRGHDAVTDAESRDLRTNGDDFPSAVGAWNDRGVAGAEVFAVGDHQVAKVERYGVYAYLHLMCCRVEMLRRTCSSPPICCPALI